MPDRPTPNLRREALLLAGAFVVAAALRGAFFVGLHWSDDLDYAYRAQLVAQGAQHYFPNNNGTRLLVFFPMALSYKLLGVNDLGATAPFLLYWLLEFGAVYGLGRLLLGGYGGVAAALLLAIMPLDALQSTTPLPDVATGAFAALSVLLFAAASRRPWRKGDSRTPVLLLSAGFVLGVGAAVRTSALLMVFFYAAFFAVELVAIGPLSWRALLPRFALVALGLLAAMSIEEIYWRSLSGHWLTKYRWVESHYAGDAAFHTDLAYFPRLLLGLAGDGRLIGWRNPENVLGLFGLAAIAGLVVALARGDWSSRLLAAWLLSVFLYMNFGSMTLGQFRLLHKLDRHLCLLSPAIALLAAHGLMWLARRKGWAGPTVAAIAATLLAVSSALAIQARYQWLMVPTRSADRAFAYLQQRDARLVYADEQTARFLRFRSQYRGLGDEGIVTDREIADCSFQAPGLVVVNGNLGWIRDRSFNDRVASCRAASPARFRLVFQAAPAAPASDVAVYEIVDSAS
jgi:4-amino-4-deoxy-L-arabinose transferase-like glycosyltransferase